MNIEQLKYYTELCRVKNFTEVGFACNLSQSALSKQIRKLEKELNVTLIRRNTRKFELNEEGEIFLKYADEALDLYEKMLTKVCQESAGSGVRMIPLEDAPHFPISLIYPKNVILTDSQKLFIRFIRKWKKEQE